MPRIVTGGAITKFNGEVAMRLPVVCIDCLMQRPGFETLQIIPFPHDYIIDFTCDRGHRNLEYVQEADWEVLITSAGLALSEGYPMEAVSAIAAGVERFAEFATKAICKSFNTSDDVIETTWKQVSRQSERQIGAFAFVYAARFNSAPPMMPPKQVEVRNAVIHRGAQPRPEQVEIYGDAAMTFVFAVHDALSTSYEAALKSTYLDQVAEKAKRLQERGGIRGLSIPNLFRVVLTEPSARKSFRQAVADQGFYRQGLDVAPRTD
jgi:hypothetical protein